MDVRRARTAVHMSQAALAAKSGIDRTRLSFAENGYTRLTEQEEAAIQGVIVEAVSRQRSAHRTVLEQIGAPIPT